MNPSLLILLVAYAVHTKSNYIMTIDIMALITPKPGKADRVSISKCTNLALA